MSRLKTLGILIREKYMFRVNTEICNIWTKWLESFIAYDRSSHRRWSVRKGVLRNFAKFTGKHLCQSVFFIKVAGWGCFSVLLIKLLLRKWSFLDNPRLPISSQQTKNSLKSVLKQQYGQFIHFLREDSRMLENISKLRMTT